MVGDRIKKRFDRKPVWRKVSDRASEPGHRLRSSIGGSFGDRIPTFKNRNFGGGVGAGAVGAGIATVLEDVIGAPFGGSTDTVSITNNDDGSTTYVVNVNSPTEDMAVVRGFIDAGTGFTSLLTDKLNVENVQLVDTRPFRDTYQIKLRVE